MHKLPFGLPSFGFCLFGLPLKSSKAEIISYAYFQVMFYPPNVFNSLTLDL